MLRNLSCFSDLVRYRYVWASVCAQKNWIIFIHCSWCVATNLLQSSVFMTRTISPKCPQQTFSIGTMSTWWRHQMETFTALLAYVQGIHRLPVNSPHKGQWRGALMFPLNCAWINGWVNNGGAGDLRRHRAHCDATVMNRCGVSFVVRVYIMRWWDS